MDTLRGRHSGQLYRLDREIGGGGMALVYQAVREDGRVFAVKRLARPDALPRHRAEMAILRGLRVRTRSKDAVIGFEEPLEEEGAFALELFEADDLGRWAARWLDAMPAQERLHVVAGLVGRVAALLLELHAQAIVHRDLTPSNVLVRGGPSDYTLRLIDFGIARQLEAGGSARLTGEMIGMGTPGYMAPEQARDAASATESADVFALAVVAAELVQGAHPFPFHEPDDAKLRLAWQDRLAAPPELTVLYRLDRELARALARGMHVRPAERPNVRGLRMAIQDAVSGRTQPAWIEPAALGESVVGWAPPDSLHGPHLPVRLPSDLLRQMAVTPRPDGIHVAVASPSRLSVVSQTRRGGTVAVEQSQVIPWHSRAPGAWHDVIPAAGEGVAVRVTRPTVARVLDVGLELRAGPFAVATAATVSPGADGVRFYAVDLAGNFIAEVPVAAVGPMKRRLDPDRGGFVFRDLRVLVVWDEASPNPLAGAFVLAGDGGPRFTPRLRGDHHARVEAALRAGSPSSPGRSNWPWPEPTRRRVEVLVQALRRDPALAACAARVTADARTWFAARHVLALRDDVVGTPPTADVWGELFATAVQHGFGRDELLVHPHNPTAARRTTGGQTRVYSGVLGPGTVMEGYEPGTPGDVWKGERARMNGASRPVIELAWVGHGPAAHLALHRPSTLTFGRWDVGVRPHMPLLVSDRVSRRCGRVAVLDGPVVESYVDYVRVSDAQIILYDPAFRRVCSRCGARWDATEPACQDAVTRAPHGATTNRPIPSVTLAVAATTHGELGRGGFLEARDRPTRALVATRCFDLVDGVTLRVEDAGDVQVHVRRRGVRVAGAIVPEGRSAPVRGGERVDVPEIGLSVEAFEPSP